MKTERNLKAAQNKVSTLQAEVQQLNRKLEEEKKKTTSMYSSAQHHNRRHNRRSQDKLYNVTRRV